MIMWVLLAATVGFGAAELMTTNLIFAPFAAATLAGAAADALGASPVAVLAVMVAVAAVGLFVVRPKMLKRIQSGPELRSGTEALLGVSGRVVTQVPADGRGVVSAAGQQWSAITHDGSGLDVGAKVWVVEVDGATLVVAAEK